MRVKVKVVFKTNIGSTFKTILEFSRIESVDIYVAQHELCNPLVIIMILVKSVAEHLHLVILSSI